MKPSPDLGAMRGKHLRSLRPIIASRNWCSRTLYDLSQFRLSTHLHDTLPPDLDAAMVGDVSSASYRLEDMDDNAVGLPMNVG